MAEKLETRIAALERENERLRMECLRNRRQELMEHLLQGEYHAPELIRTDLRQVGIDLRRESFMELFIDVLDQPPMPVLQADETYAPPENFREIFEDGIANLVRESFPDSFCAACLWKTGIVAILQMDRRDPGEDKGGNFIDDLNQKALTIIDTLSDRGMHVFVSISRPHSGIEGIQAAHSEIAAISNYRKVMDYDVPLLCFHDFEVAEAERKNETAILRLEQKYLNYIELGNYREAEKTFHALLDIEFRKGIPPLQAFSSKLFARLDLLMITLQRVFPEQEVSVYSEILQLNQEVLQYLLTISEIENRISQLFCEIQRLTEQQQEPAWLQAVLGYVNESYSNPDLNVASIAESFGMNASYLSREVKRCTGTSLLDLLQKKRLEQAVALMGSGCTMTLASEQSGFGNLPALRRAMKKYQSAVEPEGQK